jgi:hypothetical protein
MQTTQKYYSIINPITVINSKNVKMGYNNFWAGHFFGHLFLSIFKIATTFSAQFSKKLKLQGPPYDFGFFK